MTITRERYNGPITLECDHPRCADVCETECSDFVSAIQKAKSRGWVARKEGDEWVHFCEEHK